MGNLFSRNKNSRRNNESMFHRLTHKVKPENGDGVNGQNNEHPAPLFYGGQIQQKQIQHDHVQKNKSSKFASYGVKGLSKIMKSKNKSKNHSSGGGYEDNHENENDDNRSEEESEQSEESESEGDDEDE